MYERPPNLEELTAFGLTLEDVQGDPIEIWPDNMPAVRVFSAMATQWRVGMNGPTGLDYSALPEVWRRMEVPVSQRNQVFEDLRVMEAAALAEMAKKDD